MSAFIRVFPILGLLIAYLPLLPLPVFESKTLVLLENFFFHEKPLGYLLMERIIALHVTSLKVTLFLFFLIGLPGFYLAYERLTDKVLAFSSLIVFLSGAFIPLIFVNPDPYLAGMAFLGYLLHSAILLLEKPIAVIYFLFTGLLVFLFSHPFYLLGLCPFFLILPYFIRFKNVRSYYGTVLLLLGASGYWAYQSSFEFLVNERFSLPFIVTWIPWGILFVMALPLSVMHMRQLGSVKLRTNLSPLILGIAYCVGFWFFLPLPSFLLTGAFLLAGLLCYFLYHLQLSSSGMRWLTHLSYVQGIFCSLPFFYAFAFLFQLSKAENLLLWVILLAFFFLTWGFVFFGAEYEQKLLYPALLTMMTTTIFFHTAGYPFLMDFIPSSYVIRMQQVVPDFLKQFYLYRMEDESEEILKVHFLQPMHHAPSLDSLVKAREKGDVWVLTDSEGFLELVDNQIPLNRVIEIRKRNYKRHLDVFFILFSSSGEKEERFYLVRIQGKYA